MFRRRNCEDRDAGPIPLADTAGHLMRRRVIATAAAPAPIALGFYQRFGLA
jgi:hypothetical protein